MQQLWDEMPLPDTEQLPKEPLGHYAADIAKGTVKLTTMILIMVALFIGYHLVSAQISKPNPPAACQLWGGSWNFWNGWSCG